MSPFTSKSTGYEVGRFYKGRCRDLSVVVTGATSGIGFQTVVDLAKNGAKVVGTGTTKEKCQQAEQDVQAETGREVRFLLLRLDDCQSIRLFAESFRSLRRPCQVLINNAGVLSCPWAKTADGLESQFAINYFGHFLLSRLLQPERLVHVASTGHHMYVPKEGPNWAESAFCSEANYEPFTAYGSSKFAQVLHAIELSSRGTLSVSLCPGGVPGTNLMRHHSKAYWMFQNPLAAARQGNLRCMTKVKLKKREQASSTVLYAALSPDVVGGGYYVDCQLSPTHPAVNQEAAKKLWEFSETLLKDLGIMDADELAQLDVSN